MSRSRTGWGHPAVLAGLIAAVIGAAATIIAAVIARGPDDSAPPPVPRSSNSSLAATSESRSPTGSRLVSASDSGGSTTAHTELAANDAMTHSDYTNGGGRSGPTVPGGQQIHVACRRRGLPVGHGNPWWYRLPDPPWNGNFYVSADPFYNGAPTSTPLAETPFVDPAVPLC